MAAPSAPGVAATAWLRPSSAAQTRPHPLDCRGGSELEPASLLSATGRLGEPEREDTWPGSAGSSARRWYVPGRGVAGVSVAGARKEGNDLELGETE